MGVPATLQIYGLDRPEKMFTHLKRQRLCVVENSLTQAGWIQIFLQVAPFVLHAWLISKAFTLLVKAFP